jgi:hypothetical protein
MRLLYECWAMRASSDDSAGEHRASGGAPLRANYPQLLCFLIGLCVFM